MIETTGIGYTTGSAPGAIANGTPIVKVKSEKSDANPIGTKGKVLGSLDAGEGRIGYFVEWETMPGLPVLVADFKIDRAPLQ